MTAFMNWLRVELLRLRSLDLGARSLSLNWLPDGVMKFTSSYSISSLVKRLGSPENDILEAIGSASVIRELEEKSFTLNWKERTIVLAWLEEGISEWKTDVIQDYYEENGSFYTKFRWIQRIIYLDGTDRIVSDTGEPKPVKISRSYFDAAQEEIRQASNKQATSPDAE